MKNFLIIGFTFLSFTAFGQIKKTVHQTFDLAEATTLYLDLVGDYELESWPGNSVMSETRIELYDASPHILKFFLEKEERYKINQTDPGQSMTLTSNDKERKSIQYKDTNCYEEVKLKLYIPDSFEIIDKKTMKRKVED